MAKRKFLKDYNWDEIQAFYDSGNSYRDLYKEFGISHKSLCKASDIGFFKARSAGESQKISQAKQIRTYSEEYRQRMSEHALRRGLGGTRNSNKFLYTTTDGSEVKLDSSYELTVAQNLDENGISWTRPQPIRWVDQDGKGHRYYPDFYLPGYDVYLDPKHKGIIPLHEDKINRVRSQNNVKVLVLSVDELDWDTIQLRIHGDVS